MRSRWLFPFLAGVLAAASWSAKTLRAREQVSPLKHDATAPPAPPPNRTGTVVTPILVLTNPLTASSIPPAPPVAPTRATNQQASIYPRPVQDLFEAQLALSRQGISSGSVDGLIGRQTREALRAFQQKFNLPKSGELDSATKDRLLMNAPPLIKYQVTAADLARLQPISPSWLGKSQQTALDYETILELLSEKGHAHPKLLRALNPSINWTNVLAGAVVQLPDANFPDPPPKADFITIRLAEKVLEVFDANTNLLAHFPCSIAQNVAKRPVGELRVAVVAPNPNYTFDPDIFPESPEARQIKTKLVIPPGPNNPVGVAWVGLDKPGYGIHGTPSPEQVGRTESHGCFRLANWNAEYLLKMVSIGTPVFVE